MAETLSYCMSAKEYDRQAGNLQRRETPEPKLLRDVRPLGCNGGRIGERNFEFRSSLLSETLMATANANELRLDVIDRFDIPPAMRLDARRFLRLRENAFSGFAMSFMESVEVTSAKLVNDFDFPL